ncbi:MAG: sialidase, partial [Acidobacteriota bacterium]|nr:sialidase [Acidobacteriota bacterium]
MRKVLQVAGCLLTAGLLVGLAAAQAPNLLAAAQAPNPPAAAHAPNPLAALHFRFVGPQGNRDISVASVPGDPLVIYYGAASGGIWKSTNGGVSFRPVFDHADVSAVGALAVAPESPNIVWAGTGEPWIIRQPTSPGDGVYKSTDSGRHWQHMGLEQTGHIAGIEINPHNPAIVYACAVGQGYRNNPERGVYRTEDGGKTWDQVLKVNDETGCSSITMDAHDPNTLFAGMWQLTIRPWDLHSGGPG